MNLSALLFIETVHENSLIDTVLTLKNHQNIWEYKAPNILGTSLLFPDAILLLGNLEIRLWG